MEILRVAVARKVLVPDELVRDLGQPMTKWMSMSMPMRRLTLCLAPLRLLVLSSMMPPRRMCLLLLPLPHWLLAYPGLRGRIFFFSILRPCLSISF